jgi:hypothetical protein
MLVTVALFRQMLYAGYWIFSNELMVKSKIIEYPETRLQDQPGLARVFVATQWLRYSNLCNI